MRPLERWLVAGISRPASGKSSEVGSSHFGGAATGVGFSFVQELTLLEPHRGEGSCDHQSLAQ